MVLSPSLEGSAQYSDGLNGTDWLWSSPTYYAFWDLFKLATRFSQFEEEGLHQVVWEHHSSCKKIVAVIYQGKACLYLRKKEDQWYRSEQVPYDNRESRIVCDQRMGGLGCSVTGTELLDSDLALKIAVEFIRDDTISDEIIWQVANLPEPPGGWKRFDEGGFFKLVDPN